MDDAGVLACQDRLFIPGDADGAPEWNRAVESAQGDLAQTSWWAQARQSIGLEAVHIQIPASDGGLLGGGWVYAKRYAPGLRVGFVPRGPLFFADGAEEVRVGLRTFVAKARALGISLLVIQPAACDGEFSAACERLGFRFGVPSVAPEATIRVPVDRSDDALLAAMSANRRSDVRRALKAGFAVEESDDLGLFHQLHAATARRQNFTAMSLRNLEAQWRALGPAHRHILLARYDGAPVAAYFSTSFAGVTTLKLRGWDPDVQAPPRANMALVWASLLAARDRGHIYDVGGVRRSVAETLLRGEKLPPDFRNSTDAMKVGYGGEPVLFPRARFILTSPVVNAAFGAAAARLLASRLGIKLGMKMAHRGRNG